ncbi:MAG: hypothetical protein H6Q90_1362 [Deltaproteobacteria bacterium]|nr:hypothetical protein [Deltaproteobacteria bacterium]
MKRSMRGAGLIFLVALVAASGLAAADPTAAPTKATPATDYGAQARVLFRIAACGGEDPIPTRLDAKTIDRHCRAMTALYASHRKAWVDKAKAFIAEIRPKDAPGVIVYPFGGGDLSSALVAFPDATEITTISLEAAGDIRAVDTFKPSKLAHELAVSHEDLEYLYRSAYSATKNLQAASRSSFPGTLMFALAGLALHDMEPVALRYFDIEDTGALRYLSDAELELRVVEYAATKRGQTPPKNVTHFWYMHDSPFGNVEIQYRPRGDAKAPLRTYRHIVANLDNSHLDADERVLVHLRTKGKVSVMTKAASFLLWYDDFSKIRSYLLASIAWMVSDASGIPPSLAAAAGYEQVAYGEFAGPYFIYDTKNVRAEFIKLWQTQPKRPLPFRFGYPDVNKHNHLMVTRPKP